MISHDLIFESFQSVRKSITEAQEGTDRITQARLNNVKMKLSELELKVSRFRTEGFEEGRRQGQTDYAHDSLDDQSSFIQEVV